MSADCEAVAINRSTGTQDVTWVRYDETDFVYTPSAPLPTDPVIDTTLKFDLGANPIVRVDRTGLGGAGSELRVTVELNSTETIYPLSAGTVQEFPVITGAASRFAAINPLDGSGDASYVELASGSPIARDTFNFGDPTIALSAVRRVTVSIRAFKDVGTVVLIAPAVTMNGLSAIPSVWRTMPSTGAFGSFLFDLDSNPVTGLSWSMDDVRQAEFGYAGDPQTGQFRVSSLHAIFVAGNPNPSDVSLVKIWRVYDSTFSSTPPAAPGEGELPQFSATSLGPHADKPEDPGRYWYWARLYDSLYRPSVLIGPGYGEILP